MKIMFVLTIYEIGGISTIARNLIDCFKKDGFDVVLLTENLSPRHYQIDKDIKFINMSIVAQKGFCAKIFNVIKHIILMRKHIATEAPDVILSFGAYVNCHVLFSLLFCLNKRPKIILDEQSEEMFLKTKNKNIRYVFFKTVYRISMFLLYCRADYIVAVSGSIASSIKKMFLMPPDKVRVIYNFVNINRIKELCKEKDPLPDLDKTLPCLGTVARLSPEKGVHFLIQGFKGLLDKIDARLLIVGDGAERLRLEQMAEELGIQKKVIFTGYVDNPFKYIKKMDVFILPSLWEGFPNVLLEAMACGVPVIATNSAGGIKEAVRNRINGLVIEPGLPSAIAESVYYLLSNTEERKRIIEEAHKTVRQFDVEKIKREYENLILN